jgi:hypothetical protein
MLLDRKILLTKEKLETVKVDLGNDEFVFVRQMTGRERDNFEQSLLKRVTKNDSRGRETVTYEQSLSDFRAKLAVCCLSDEEGNALLQPNDYIALSQAMSAAKLEKIVNEAQKLNKISEEDKDELVKNSDAGEAGNSISDSVES